MADQTAVRAMTTRRTQKKGWPTVCMHGGCSLACSQCSCAQSSGMSVIMDEKPRQAITVSDEMIEQRSSQTMMYERAYLGSTKATRKKEVWDTSHSL